MQQWPLPKTFAKVETVRVPPSFCAETLLQKSFGAATEFLKSLDLVQMKRKRFIGNTKFLTFEITGNCVLVCKDTSFSAANANHLLEAASGSRWV